MSSFADDDEDLHEDAEEDRLRTPDERLAGQKLSRAAGGAV